MWALPFAYEPCDLGPTWHHSHTLTFSEKYSRALMPALYIVRTPPEEAPWNVMKGKNTGVPELMSRWGSRCNQHYPIAPASGGAGRRKTMRPLVFPSHSR